MSLGEIAAMGLALALGSTIGLLGAVLCVGIVSVPIFSRIADRLRRTILSVRRELGRGAEWHRRGEVQPSMAQADNRAANTLKHKSVKYTNWAQTRFDRLRSTLLVEQIDKLDRARIDSPQYPLRFSLFLLFDLIPSL